MGAQRVFSVLGQPFNGLVCVGACFTAFVERIDGLLLKIKDQKIQIIMIENINMAVGKKKNTIKV